jgi:hypothetical protein
MWVGRRTTKLDPRPTALETAMVPRIISQNCRVIVRPSPVPPNSRVVEESA